MGMALVLGLVLLFSNFGKFQSIACTEMSTIIFLCMPRLIGNPLLYILLLNAMQGLLGNVVERT